MREETISTLTPLVITSTLAATPAPAPSQTATPFLAQPTAAQTPVEGMTSTQVNVRSEPSTSSDVLGTIPANTKIEITGKDPGEGWWQINYPLGQGADGKGWVTAQYVTTTTTPEVPIIGGKEEDPNQGNLAVVQQQINVRSGPGTDFNSLGTLNPREVVVLVGKDANGVWLQIRYESGPEGKGWVNAAFVQAQGVDLSGLPIITETGLLVGTETPTSIPRPPTSTIVPAWDDQDSPNKPIASVTFEASGTQTLIYHGDLSSPQGDSEDWIAFRTYSDFVFVSLECHGSNSVEAKFVDNSFPVNAYVKCNDPVKQILVKPDSNYLIHLQATLAAGSLEYTNYILTIKTRPS